MRLSHNRVVFLGTHGQWVTTPRKGSPIKHCRRANFDCVTDDNKLIWKGSKVRGLRSHSGDYFYTKAQCVQEFTM